MAAAVLLALLVAGCSSGDYGSQSAAVSSQPTVVRADPAPPAAVPGRPDLTYTGEDGYPNVNVDTAGRGRVPVRSVDDRNRLEAELMALGERQRSGADTSKPQSVIQELQDLGRRSKAEAERQIESGAPPHQP